MDMPEQIDHHGLKRSIFRYASLIIMLSFVYMILWYDNKATPERAEIQQDHEICPFLSKERFTPDEQRVAKQCSTDTLPELMRKGLIEKYERNTYGTYIAVNGNLWKNRSKFFKQSLMMEVLAYNKVNCFQLSTKVIDSLSSKLYVQISEASKIDFYD